MSQYDDRKDYAKGALNESGFHPEHTLRQWLDEAKAADPTDYNAMTLSTLGEDGHPDARIVLLRHVEEAPLALHFYTNYRSAKGRQLVAHPHASVTFFWRELERQLRVRGRVERLPESVSDAYFASRPRASQLGAWASEQSQTISSRDALEQQRQSVEGNHPGEVLRPAHWGGFRVHAEELEFWQGRPGRLHDRLSCHWESGAWRIGRLQP